MLKKKENEAKIKALIQYFDSKKNLLDSLAKTKKTLEERKNQK